MKSHGKSWQLNVKRAGIAAQDPFIEGVFYFLTFQRGEGVSNV